MQHVYFLLVTHNETDNEKKIRKLSVNSHLRFVKSMKMEKKTFTGSRQTMEKRLFVLNIVI